MVKPKTAALITAGVAVTAGIAYMVYFDHQRHNDPNLKKKLSKF
jgi:import receptor subunit TOM20